MIGMHVSHYKFAQDAVSPTRERKVFLHKKTIGRLEVKAKEGGLTIIPTRLYLKNNRIKLQVSLARGKKLYDKKQVLKKRDQEREKAREMGRY